MPFHATLPFRPKVSSDLPLPTPASPSKKRMSEVSLQDGNLSESEPETKTDNQGVEDKADVFGASAAFSSAPLSRKQRRRQLRSVSKQSVTQQTASQPDLQPRLGIQDSKHGAPFPVEVSELVGGYTGFAEVSEHASVLLQLMRSPKRVLTEGQVPLSPATPTRPEIKIAYASSLASAESCTAALVDIEEVQIAEKVTEIVVVGYNDKEKDTKGPEIGVEVEEIELGDDDRLGDAQETKQKKRPRERERGDRQRTSESTATSNENTDDSAETSPIIIGTEFDNADGRSWGRKQSIAISAADTLVEEGISSQYEDTTSNSEGMRPKKRFRSQNEEEDLPATRKKFFQLEDEEITNPVEVIENENSFIETIRQMLTNNSKQATEVTSSITSPIPKKYMSPSEIFIDTGTWNLNLNLNTPLGTKEVEVTPGYGPQPRPLMPRNWIEARTWDMTPPIHGTRKTYTNASQLEYETSFSKPSLSLKSPYTLPPLTTLWAVSRHLEQKKASINEHSKREGLRWQVMKAVERNLDVQKRREKREWPRNWNEEVVKDEEYMRKMGERVKFLMRS